MKVMNRQSGNPKPGLILGLPNNPHGSRYLPAALLEKIASSSIGSPTLKRLEPLVERNSTRKYEGLFAGDFCTVNRQAKSATADRCWANLNCIVPRQIPRSRHWLPRSRLSRITGTARQKIRFVDTARMPKVACSRSRWGRPRTIFLQTLTFSRESCDETISRTAFPLISANARPLHCFSRGTAGTICAYAGSCPRAECFRRAGRK